MFAWLLKKKHPEEEGPPEPISHEDEIEESLWEIKDQYDLPTEEIINVVQSKRKNLNYMRKILSQKKN